MLRRELRKVTADARELEARVERLEARQRERQAAPEHADRAEQQGHEKRAEVIEAIIQRALAPTPPLLTHRHDSEDNYAMWGGPPFGSLAARARERAGDGAHAERVQQFSDALVTRYYHTPAWHFAEAARNAVVAVAIAHTIGRRNYERLVAGYDRATGEDLAACYEQLHASPVTSSSASSTVSERPGRERR